MQIRPTLLVALSLASLVAMAAAPAAQEPDPKPPAWVVPAPLAAVLPNLMTQSGWRQDTTFEGDNPDKTRRGVYPVGNGRVFTYMGLGPRANTMMALSGPTYAATQRRLPRGNFGELTLDLGSTALPVQKVRRVSGANFVVTEDSTAAGLALRTLTFAAPDSTTITRVVTVTNGTGAAIARLRLHARLTGASKAAGRHLVVSYADDGHAFDAAFALSEGATDGGTLVSDLGDLAAGASVTRVLQVTTGPRGVVAAPPTIAAANAAALSTQSYWTAKLAGTPKLRTNHDRLSDLFLDWKVLMLTMRDAGSGVVSPMVTRRGAWIRESTGPLLTFLRFNMWDEAKALLQYYHDAIRLTGEVREYYPLDLDRSGLPGKAVAIDAIQVPDSDLASWVILQHFWYYRATYDTELVKQRQDFLLHLLKRQKPGQDSLIRFSGHESYMDPTLYSLNLDQLPNPLFIANSPAHGRRAWSLAGSVAFLIAIQGYGEMMDGIDRMENPKKWAGDTNGIDKPSQKWVERSFKVMQDIEKRFWVRDPGFPVRDDLAESLKFGDDWKGLFAPAVSPVTGTPHKEPFANVNLSPLWIGFTFPTGERSRHNLRNTLGRLWHAKTAAGERENTLVGTTASVGHFTGEVPGMLLTALIERDGRDRVQALQDLMQIAEPACEWGRFYAPDGRPIASPDDASWPDRLSPNECGINVDAAIYALNGVRHVNVPNFDNRAIKVKLRLPPGASFLNMDNLKKDGRAFNVHVDEFFAPLSADERKQNDAQQDPKYKRDPNIDHRRFRFRMRLLSDNPPQGRYQVDADVSGTMFVRYLFRGKVGGETGEIEEREFWREDGEQFFIDGSPTVAPAAPPPQPVAGADLLVLTNRPQCAETLGGEKTTIIDTGLPLRGPELVDMMLTDGKPSHPILFLDVGFDASDERTFKRQQFWQNPAWQKALADFGAAGGKVVRPVYVHQFAVRQGDGFRATAAPNGRLQLDGKGPATVRFEVTSNRDRDDVVLRIGTGCGYKLTCNGTAVGEEADARAPLRDLDALLVGLVAGKNLFEVVLADNGAQVLFARFSDARGLPVPGLQH